MPTSAAVRQQIESALARRIPGALTPRPRVIRELASTGVLELDALLDGGLPVGAISEFVGPHSSGRSSLALAVMAEMTRHGRTVAWVDTSDALDPESAAAAGVDLSGQLWVRCGQGPPVADARQRSRAKDLTRTGAAFLIPGSGPLASSGGCGSPHPRGEARGLSEAVDAFLQQPDAFSRPAPPRDPAVSRRNRMIGTPSAPNRKLPGRATLDRTPQDARPLPRRARDREEQIPTDRQPSRRQMLHAQRAEWNHAKTLKDAQILHTTELAVNRPGAGSWTDNQNNAHGRCLATPPNAIAAGMPRFREMEAKAAGQGHGIQSKSSQWKPAFDTRSFQKSGAANESLSASCVENENDKAIHTEQADAVHSSVPDAAAKRPRQNASLAGEPPASLGKKASPVWQRLDQALRATDLLLAAGGFSAIVLDLGNIAAEFSWRIPLATWFRFRAAAERARTVLLVLTQHPCARSSAELVLRLDPAELQDGGTVPLGARFHVVVDRRRFDTSAPDAGAPVHTLHLVSSRKPPTRAQGANWYRTAVWTGAEHPQPQGGF